MAFKILVAGVFAGVAVWSLGNALQALFALLGAVALGIHAARDLLAPVRLAADADGIVVVRGFARTERIPWSAVERIRVDERARLGGRSRLVEIDTGETLHLFGAGELGAPVDEVVAALHRLSPAR
ncbi:MAG: PH domain-containing protein [Dactylosporangium sp.]|nr:PH domain-containing protein [Dactylosporangium sp.]NNJ61555.1 PH domain-containing protein [Dactylosporangium sp.]